MQDILILILTFLSSVAGAWIYTKILNEELSVWYALISGFVNTVLWVVLLRYSSKTLIGLSAWFDVVMTMGYFLGFIMLGQTVTMLQLFGIVLLTAGMYFINYA